MATKLPARHGRPTSDLPLDPVDSDAKLARLEAVLARTPALLWTTDAELRCDVTSESAARRLGLAVGMSISDGVLNGSDGVGAAAHRAALLGTSRTYELRSGRAVLSCLVEPLHDADGNISGVLGSAQDVSERYDAASIVATQRNVFETMLDQSLVGIGICDADGKFLFVNAALNRIAQEDPTEQGRLADAHHIWGDWCADGQVVPLEDWPIARALRGETTIAREMYHDGANGRIHQLFAATPVRDADGALIGAVITGADITRRKQMEEETRALNDALERRVRERTLDLERAQQTLLDFLDHSTAVIYLKDDQGRYLRINRLFERLFNVKNEEVVGRTNADLFSAATVTALRANDRHVLQTGESLQVEEHVPTNGEDRTYLSVKFPLRDAHGVIYGLCGISTDITERTRIEGALRRSQATLAAVIESSPDPIWAVDSQVQLIAFNQAASRFISDVIGTAPSSTAKLRHLVPPDVLDRWQNYLERVLSGERFTVEESLMVGDVSRRLLVSLTPMIEDSRVTGAAAFTKDITEMVSAEEQARRHQADLAHVLRLHTMGELAANLAHEVNQPLGAIANYAQGVRRRLDAGGIEPADLRRSVERIAREALRAGEITRRVRGLLRKEQSQRAAVSINDVVAAAIGVSEPVAQQHAVRLEVHLATILPSVQADAIQIEQVVLNLVLNGIEAIGDERAARWVRVDTAMAGNDAVLIRVHDSGDGIAPGIGLRIFEPFLTTKPGGLGMGLAISRSIVEAHAGEISTVDAPDGGACFTVTLPITPPG